MSSIPETSSSVSPTVLAALLLAATSVLRGFDLPRPSTQAILDVTLAKRSQAYALRDRLRAMLPTLQTPPGRPRRPATDAPTDAVGDLRRDALRYVMDHPGSVEPRGARRHYSDDFRLFAVDLRQRHPDLDVEQVADAIDVPPTTLREWMRAGATVPEPSEPEPAPPPSDPLWDLQLQTVLAAWRSWDGSFTAFCQHLGEHHHIPLKRTAVASLLHRAGERIPDRRRGRSPDESALRRSFSTFFPGAQWTGDGTPVTVSFDGELFVFNLELVVDTSSAAAVGIDVRDHENADAVIAAFGDGLATTGAPPLCLLLDNKPSNHAPEVDSALGDDTIRMRATVGRPQNKAHVEGAFGLFFQAAPPIVIDGATKRERARQMLLLQTRTWARTLNHRPRASHRGLTRHDLYLQSDPFDEDIARARETLRARAREQQRAHETRRARQDPLVRRTLDEAFSRLHLDDPEGNIHNAIAGHPLDAVIEGIAIFEGRRRAATLPDGADARYLLGIVRNLASETEGMAVAERLWDLRRQARDRVFAPLLADHDVIAREHVDHDQRLRALVDRGLAVDRGLDRFFWLMCAVDIVRAQPDDEHRSLFRIAARRIHGTHRVPLRDRHRATRFLAAKLLLLG
jgi:hypothetical protein